VAATDARELLDGLRRELEPVERRIREHALLAAIEAGEAGESALRAFAAEQQLIIASDRRSFAHLAGRFPEPPAGDFFLDLARGEGEALALLQRFAGPLGAGVGGYEPLAGCQAYPAFVSWLALSGGRADVALAFLVNLEAWGEACRRIAAALRARHDVAFFDFFAEPPPGFAERALAVAEQGLAAGEQPERARRAARLLQAYELLYWDTLADALH
jgi:hypothetical protein